MSTPTPRTDAASALTSQHRHDDLFEDTEFGWVTSGFARMLERELATERKKVRVLHKALKNIKNSICRVVPDGYSQPCVDESAHECDRIIDKALKEVAK